MEWTSEVKITIKIDSHIGLNFIPILTGFKEAS